MPKNNLAFALDYPTLADARPTLQKLGGDVGFAKIGLELFTREGPSAIQSVIDLHQDAADRFDIFLDLKLHDIPQTVERAVANACALNVRLLTVHTCGGPAMLERAAKRAETENTGLRLLGVTVLTSLDASDLEAVGVVNSPSDQVLRLARLAWSAGVRGFVCSPKEVAVLREALGDDALLVTPGIRLSGAASQDQKRIATPRNAVADGADVLVVGRPIRDADDPARAARAIVREVDDALAERSGTVS